MDKNAVNNIVNHVAVWLGFCIYYIENVSTWEGLEPSTFGFMPVICCPMFFNTGSGGIDIF